MNSHKRTRSLQRSSSPNILRLLSLLLAAAAGLIFLTGCQEEADKEKTPKDTRPPANVNLPAIPPDLGVQKTPDKHADGSLTVTGLLRNRPKYLTKEITVKGHITSVYDCPHWEKNQPKRRRPKKGKTKKDQDPNAEAKMCQRPHFYIADKADAKDKLLLVVRVSPFLQEKFDEEAIKTGELHVLTGTFIEIAEGFTAADQGLLELTGIKGFEPEVEEEK